MYKIGTMVICLALLAAGGFYLKNIFYDSIDPLKGSSVSSQASNKEKFSEWREFVPQSKLFEVKFPYPPQYARDLIPIEDSVQKRRFDMYASEKIDGTLFLINVITYPDGADLSYSEEILRQTIDELTKDKPDNRLTKSENAFFEKYPALDFTIINRDLRVEGKAFIAGQVVYVLSYVVRASDFEASDYQYFIDSFHLLPSHSP